MTTISTPSSVALMPGLEAAWHDVDISFDRFCLVAGIGAVEQVLREDAQRLSGPRHGHGGGRIGHQWGITKGKIGFHGGNVAVQRPGVAMTAMRRAAKLDGDPGRGLAWPLGHEPDADQRYRRASSGALYGFLRAIYPPLRRRHLEIGGVGPVRGATVRAHGRMDSLESVQTGLAGDPDRRPTHRRRPGAGRRPR